MNVKVNSAKSLAGRIGVTGVCAWVLVCTAGTALAQSEAPLKGPAVKDNGIPGERQSFSKGGAKGKKEVAADAPIPPRMFLGAMKVLRGDEVAENVRLTPEQNDKIQAIQKEFGSSVEAYMKQNGEEVRSLLAKLSPEDRRMVEQRFRGAFQNGKGPAWRDPDRVSKKGGDRDQGEMQADAPAANEADQAAAKARLKELMQAAPSPKDAQSKVWSVLTDQQRPLVEAELKHLREQGDKGGRPGAGPGAAPEDRANPSLENLPPKLRERLQNMTPQEREEAMRKLQERRQGGKGGKGGEPKPAPNIDDVMVPPAEKSTSPK